MTDQDTDQVTDQDNDQVNGKLGLDVDLKAIEQRKISVFQWLDFMEIIIGNGSFNLTFKMNRNSYTTTKYWMKKLFLILEKRKGHGAFI
ncbi:MAG: hypothetical protein SPF69_03445 [Candidatus Ornithospirochaeta sp.]|nr:hypothetical protein [Sphaerochaetaceae bacterium]MDY5523127.1 hypothetical protein [Candidatus Ornithospirochaeta sp.]